MQGSRYLGDTPRGGYPNSFFPGCPTREIFSNSDRFEIPGSYNAAREAYYRSILERPDVRDEMQAAADLCASYGKCLGPGGGDRNSEGYRDCVEAVAEQAMDSIMERLEEAYFSDDFIADVIEDIARIVRGSPSGTVTSYALYQACNSRYQGDFLRRACQSQGWVIVQDCGGATP